jgi:hypothetical protein
MASGHKKRLKTLRLLGNKERLKRLEERLEKRLEKRLKRLWVRIGATMKRLIWTSVGRWWLAWVSGATTTRYHTQRPTASTRQHGPRSLAAIISERGRVICLAYRTSIQADYVRYWYAEGGAEAIEAPWVSLGEGVTPVAEGAPQVMLVTKALEARGRDVSMTGGRSRGSGVGNPTRS